MILLKFSTNSPDPVPPDKLCIKMHPLKESHLSKHTAHSTKWNNKMVRKIY